MKFNGLKIISGLLFEVGAFLFQRFQIRFTCHHLNLPSGRKHMLLYPMVIINDF